MKKKFLAILSAAMMFSVMGAGSGSAAPAKAVPTESHITLKSGSVNVYDYGDVKLHAYFTNDPLADVAYIVEGKEALAGIELPAFTAGLDTWKDYVKSLGKPMNDIFIVCHPAGASYIKGMNVYGTEGAQKSIVSAVPVQPRRDFLQLSALISTAALKDRMPLPKKSAIFIKPKKSCSRAKPLMNLKLLCRLLSPLTTD